MRFLEEIADKILQADHKNLSAVAVVLPSRRAGMFLRRYLADRIQKPFFPPQLLTFNDFLFLYTKKRIAELPELLFLLYEVYVEITGEQAESFDKFSKWGQILLSDFNEIDRYLVDPKKVFTDLRNIKLQELEIESWSFHNEALSENQERYLEFWKGLPEYHAKFAEKLAAKKLSYAGMLYREVAENIDDLIRQHPFGHTYFAGFNALSASEMKIISSLHKAEKASLFFDADKWYTNDGDHEAGLFFRKLRNQWGDYGFEFMSDYFATVPKKVKVISTPGNVAQARVAGEILQEMSAEGNYSDTALVLGDENLLLPVLNSFPEQLSKVNITMGFPLRTSDYFQIIHLLFELQSTLKNSSHSGLHIYYRPFLNLILHPVIQDFLEGEVDLIKSYIEENNKIYLDNESFANISGPKVNQLLFLLLQWKNIPQDPVNDLQRLNDLLSAFYVEKKRDKLTLEYIYHFSHIIQQLKNVCMQYDYLRETNTLLNLFRQYVSQSSISFFGEPLDGLQLMGMLETRALDFRKVIVLSVNENVLPKSKQEHSFMLHEVKKLYGLPTYREKDAVFANHFYRLLQRAEEVYLVYNSDTDALQGGEKSRFIQQLEQELKQVSPDSSIGHFVAKPDHESRLGGEFLVQKTPEIIDKIKKHLVFGISPSALNKYLECPLNYYYRYVLGLKEADEVDEVADHAILGTIIHEVLETFYLPLEGKVISADNVKAMLKEMDTETRKQFRKHAGFASVEAGMNHLVFLVAIEFIQNFLQSELSQIENGKVITLLKTETKIEAQVNVFTGREEIPVKISGKADRIDWVDQQIRIIDYKTGGFQKTDIDIADTGVILQGKKGKALQLLAYAKMFHSTFPENEKAITSGIVPLKYKVPVYEELKLNKQSVIGESEFKGFEQLLTDIVMEMLNENIPFSHKKSAQFCQLCN